VVMIWLQMYQAFGLGSD